MQTSVSACEVNTPKVVVPVIFRIAAFAAYPTTYSRLQFFEMIADVLAFMGDQERMRQLLGSAAAVKLNAEGHLAHWQAEALAFAEYRPRLEENLLGQG